MSAEILAKADAAAKMLNDVLREAARENFPLSLAIKSEPLRHGEPGPQVDLVAIIHHGIQEGRRPENLNSANDD